VDVLESTEDLVEKVADVVIAEFLCLQQLVKVSLHQALHDVPVTNPPTTNIMLILLLLLVLLLNSKLR